MEKREKIRCFGCMEEYESIDDVCPHCGYEQGTPPNEMYHLKPGTILENRYIVGKVLGFGGFGITYISWDKTLMRKVAIKEYLPGECATRIPGDHKVTIFEGEKEEQFHKGIEKFLDEAKKLKQFVSLEGIVKIFDCFETNDTAYLVMECLEGETLASWIGKDKKVSMEDTLNMLLPMISSLKEIHKENVIHRDIAPDNIFITKEGSVKLLDFGSARYVALAQSKSLSVIIKPGYAPPEQYQSHGNQGPWTDVYSLAATMYRMLTGKVPQDAMERLGKDELVPPSKLGVKIVKEQEIALLNALNTTVGSRTQSMDAFESQLLLTDTVERVKDGTTTYRKKKNKTGLKFTAAAVVVVGVGLGALLGTGVIHSGANDIVGKIDYSSGLVENYIGSDYASVVDTAKDNNVELIISNTKNKTEDGTKLKDDSIGVILEQNPDAGESLENCDGKIQVILSAGTKTSKVKDFVGYSKKEAKKIAQESNVGILFAEEKGENYMIPGYVIEQEAKEGDEVPKDSVMVLTISLGSKTIDTTKKIKMPSLKNKTLKEALQLADVTYQNN